MTDRYNCSGDYRDACTLVGQGLRHISLKSPRARRLYDFKLLLENGCLSRFVTHLKIHIFALRWKDEIQRSSQLLKRVVVVRFKSRTGLNFFQVQFTTIRFSSVLSCKDLLISSLHRSANI